MSSDQASSWTWSRVARCDFILSAAHSCATMTRISGLVRGTCAQKGLRDRSIIVIAKYKADFDMFQLKIMRVVECECHQR